MKLRRLLIYLVVALCAVAARAQAWQTDSLRVSLLTCSPGTLVYEIYGHTALRVEDFTRGRDDVFNYGVFSFSQPHFIAKFVLGQCDYMCDYYPYSLFEKEYAERGSSVTEQELNLTHDEAVRLVALLADNVRPENRTYRYNFLLTNCTTRVRDIIEQAVGGTITYKPSGRRESFRDILHQYTRPDYPYYELGNDLLLGCSVDTLVTDRAAMFAPERMMKYADEATLADGRPLVRRTTVLLAARPRAARADISPAVFGWAFAALMLVVGFVEWRTRRMAWGLDAALMTLQGLAGLLLAFMFCFSEHPGVGSNWQLWVLNPLPLVALPWVVRCAVKHQRCAYHRAAFAWLLLFVALYGFLPQQFTVVTLPLTIGLALREASYIIYYRR